MKIIPYPIRRLHKDLGKTSSRLLLTGSSGADCNDYSSG